MVVDTVMGVNDGAVISKLLDTSDTVDVSGIVGPMMQLSQYQGLLRQLAVVFLLLVHFL